MNEGTAKVGKSAQVPEAMDNLSSGITRCADLSVVMKERLVTVIAQDSPEPCGSQPEDETSYVGLAQNVRQATLRVDAIANALEIMIDRIEL